MLGRQTSRVMVVVGRGLRLAACLMAVACMGEDADGLGPERCGADVRP
jgi:hypothetical protein